MFASGLRFSLILIAIGIVLASKSLIYLSIQLLYFDKFYFLNIEFVKFLERRLDRKLNFEFEMSYLVERVGRNLN